MCYYTQPWCMYLGKLKMNRSWCTYTSSYLGAELNCSVFYVCFPSRCVAIELYLNNSEVVDAQYGISTLVKGGMCVL